MISYSIEQTQKIIGTIKRKHNKLILVAGSSSSGKSYFAGLIAEQLRKEGKKVLEISSDSYYTNDTGIKFLLYGTFDHPDLIDYDLLNKNIKEYLKTGKTSIPEYSFKSRGRVGFHTVQGNYDYVIVEGLYTLGKIDSKLPTTKLYITSNTEELIFRRLIRDQERVNEPLYMILGMMNKVFPMWNLYGKPQMKLADAIVHNDYEILEQKGTAYEYLPLKKVDASLGKKIKTQKVVKYVYEDQAMGNGYVEVNEIYKPNSTLLDEVRIAKTKKIASKGNRILKKINMSFTQPGISTEIHTLLQTAGLQCTKIIEKTESMYKKGNDEIFVVTEGDKSYKKVIVANKPAEMPKKVEKVVNKPKKVAIKKKATAKKVALKITKPIAKKAKTKSFTVKSLVGAR